MFVSHSSDDNPVAKRIVADLRDSGHTVWVDHSDLAAGQPLAGAIQRGIETSDAFLLLLSRRALESNWVDIEWQSALSRLMSDDTYTFLLVQLDDVEIPLLLRSKKWIDLRAGYEEALQALKHSLGPAQACAPDKPSVWYFDDQPEWTEAFVERHSCGFRVRIFNELVDLLPALDQATVMPSQMPDIVLLDLYCPREQADPSILDETSRRLSEFFRAERELKKYVDDAWRPIGVDIVESVREFYPPEKLPVAMHTQQGLILLRDELLQELEAMSVGWLLKNRFSPETDRMVLERVIMQSGHRMGAGKQRLLVIDDNPAFLDAFVERQGDYYEIETLESQAEVLRTLNRMDGDGVFPDVFLVDMYYPRGGPGSQELIDVANQKLREFAELEEELRAAVEQSYEPIGLSALKQIRRILSADELPVLIYTQSGLLTLGDKGIQEIERLGGGWLLKDRYDTRTEQSMICGEIIRARRARGGAIAAR